MDIQTFADTVGTLLKYVLWALAACILIPMLLGGCTLYTGAQQGFSRAVNGPVAQLSSQK